jgi:large repetitive protein
MIGTRAYAAAVITLAGALGGAAGAFAAFSAVTQNSGNSFQAAASFCATTTVIADADTYSNDGAKTTTHGTEINIWTRGGADKARAFVRFTLPAKGSCTLASATLELFGSSGTTDGTTRVLVANRAASSWGESTLTWNNQPGTSGTAATTTVVDGFFGWSSWTVTANVSAMYASGGETSFVVVDSVETGNNRHYTRFDSREGTNKPKLVLNFA